MNDRRFGAAARYLFRDYALSLIPFYGIFVLVVIGSILADRYLQGDVSFSGFGVGTAIALMVYGIVTPRPNLRLCVQFGISRRTAFSAQLLAVTGATALLAAAGEVLLAVGQLLRGDNPSLLFTDLYGALYGGGSWAMTFGGHVINALFNLTMMLMLYALGMFLTFLFWRLRKFWTVVVAIAIPVVLNGVPLLLRLLATRSAACARALAAFGRWLAASGWNAMALFVLSAALFTLFSWLLVRRANIRAPKDA